MRWTQFLISIETNLIEPALRWDVIQARSHLISLHRVTYCPETQIKRLERNCLLYSLSMHTLKLAVLSVLITNKLYDGFHTILTEIISPLKWLPISKLTTNKHIKLQKLRTHSTYEMACRKVFSSCPWKYFCLPL